MAVPVPPPDRLPDGFAVRLDPGVRRRDGGAGLLGGTPLRLLRLSPRAQQLLTGDRLAVRDATGAVLAARLLDAGLAHPEQLPPRADPVTVVIPVRDRTAALARLLAALRADAATATARVVVVDDGSTDPAAVSAVTSEHSADLLRHDAAQGPAAARNAGLRAARTPVVVFVDSDCVPRPGWLPPLLAHLADPRLAAVAPRIVGLPPARPGWVTPYEAVASALDLGARPAPVRPFSAVPYVPTAALVTRREALGRGFDDRMPVAEDVDLVWRLAAAGWRVRYEPAAAVAHEHPAGTAAWLRRRAFYGTGAALLAARHGCAVAPLVVSPWSAVAWVLAVTGWRRPWPGTGPLGAAAVLAMAAGRLAARLHRPGEPPPVALSAGLVLRGTLAAGRALARTVTRHHWPLALTVGAVSLRARRALVAVALADGLAAWWPQRRAVGPVRFLVARRAEDLAYGAGLWWGALRARDVRALLPTRPPRI